MEDNCRGNNWTKSDKAFEEGRDKQGSVLPMITVLKLNKKRSSLALLTELRLDSPFN